MSLPSPAANTVVDRNPRWWAHWTLAAALILALSDVYWQPLGDLSYWAMGLSALACLLPRSERQARTRATRACGLRRLTR